jgi:hypothetical protein
MAAHKDSQPDENMDLAAIFHVTASCNPESRTEQEGMIDAAIFVLPNPPSTEQPRHPHCPFQSPTNDHAMTIWAITTCSPCGHENGGWTHLTLLPVKKASVEGSTKIRAAGDISIQQLAKELAVQGAILSFKLDMLLGMSGRVFRAL